MQRIIRNKPTIRNHPSRSRVYCQFRLARRRQALFTWSDAASVLAGIGMEQAMGIAITSGRYETIQLWQSIFDQQRLTQSFCGESGG
jgi:hypothetical protein